MRRRAKRVASVVALFAAVSVVGVPTPSPAAARPRTACALAAVEIPVLPRARFAELYDVKALSADDAWTVGMHANRDGFMRPLAAHWDGSVWTRVPVPPPGDGHAVAMTRLTAVSSTDVWAIGRESLLPATPNGDFLGPRSGPDFYRLPGVLYHWDGQAWSILPVHLWHAVATFAAIEAVGPNDLWVVGSWQALPAGSGPHSPPLLPLVLHWDGATWTKQHPTLFPGEHITWMTDVDTTSPAGVLAVGIEMKNWRRQPTWFSVPLQGGSWTTSPSPGVPGIRAVSGAWGIGPRTLVTDPIDSSDKDVVVDAYQLGMSGWTPSSSPVVVRSIDNGWGAFLSDIWAEGDEAWSVGALENQDGGAYIAGAIAEVWTGGPDWSLVTLPDLHSTDWLSAVDVAPAGGADSEHVFMVGSRAVGTWNEQVSPIELRPLVIQTIC